MDISTIALGGIGAAVIGFWNQFRSLLGYMRGLVIVKLEVDTLECSPAVAWLDSKRGFIFGDPRLLCSRTHKKGSLINQVYKDSWSKTFRVVFLPAPVIAKVVAKTQHGLTLSYIRGTVDTKKLALEIQTSLLSLDSECVRRREQNEEEDSFENSYNHEPIFYCVENVHGSLGELVSGISRTESMGNASGYSPASSQPSVPSKEDSELCPIPLHYIRRYSELLCEGPFFAPRKNTDPFADLYYGPEVQFVERKYTTWSTMGSWYKERGIPWKLGLTLVGPPGTGKTSLIRALAQKYCARVWLFSLATFRDGEFDDYVQKIAEITRYSRQIQFIVFEDVGAYFQNRKTAQHVQSGTNGVPLTFETFLNAIDGVKQFNGVVFIATDNHEESLDPAILRPFRFGKPIYFGNLPAEGREKIAKFMLHEWPDLVEQALKLPDMPGAEFKDACQTMALNRMEETL